jgi:4-amino-4-deoxy-L-arabinose transferase-like glycosyltransferase
MGDPSDARRDGGARPAGKRRSRTVDAIVLAIFLSALACRSVAFFRPHLEGDEVVYAALVENLDAGRGYTLQGHPLLERRDIVRETYGRPLFFHPPGGIALFWALHALFGEAGFGLAQLLAFTVFFWAMLSLASQSFGSLSGLQALLVASLAGFTPIMTHVVSRFWLDGPLLAFATAAAAVFLRACRRESLAWAGVAGLLLGYASLIKPTALLVVPGTIALAWAAGAPRSLRSLLRHGLCWVGVAACLLAPWQAYQWHVIGNPFAVSPGRPAPRLLAINRFVHYLTVVRSPWIYLSLLPRVVWTLGPSLLLLVARWRDASVRRVGLALGSWIGVVVAVHVALGFVGYSKLLRYVILVSPATVLLFALVTSASWSELRAGSRSRLARTAGWALVALALLAFVLEIAQGLATPLLDPSDLIRPFGLSP